MKRHSSNSTNRAVIVAGSLIGVVALLGVLYSGAFGTFGNVQNLQSGTVICDLKGTLSGTANDYNVNKFVSDLSMVSGSSNCHQKGIAEFNLVNPASVPQGALLSPGQVTIYINAVDHDSKQVWGSDTFTVNTDFGQVQKQFRHDFAFNKLPQGKQFDIIIQSSWKGDTPELVKTITA